MSRAVSNEAIAAVIDRIDRPLWVVTAQSGARRGGLVATFVVPASIVPSCPRVVAGIARHHHTWKLIEQSGAFALHLLREDQLDLVWRFGAGSGHDVDKLEGVPHSTGVSGSPILDDALAWLDCRVETSMSSGDRSIYLAEVLDGSLTSQDAAMTAAGLQERAPADRLRLLDEQLVRDIEIDERAIAQWRARRKGSPRSSS
jgi:flavin reductase (DIM6/NTAB) family NADH-FMN oxidoreductase RutF